MNPLMRRTSAALAALVCSGLACWLVWRIAIVSDQARRGEIASVEQRLRGDNPEAEEEPEEESARDGADPRTGITGVTLKYFDPDDGRLVLIVRAARGDTRGAVCKLEDVTMERRLDDGRGKLVASSRTGSYDRKKGSGQMKGSVLVRRLPAGEEQPDVVIRSEELKWSRGATRLTSDLYVEMSWLDRARGRTLSARGLGLLAERWAQRVRLREDVCVSMVGSALPRGLDFGGVARERAARRRKLRGPLQTVINAGGPATFEYDSDAGRHRAHFTRQVTVKVRSLKGGEAARQLNCDELEVFFRAENAPGSGDSPVLAAGSSAACAPLALPASSRWLAASLRPAALGMPREAGNDPGPGKKRRLAGVDLVVARGSVVIRAPEGVARGELGWYDHPAGVLWLEGRAGEAAELVRTDEDHQVLARRFFYNVRTGDMQVPRGDRVRITIE